MRRAAGLLGAGAQRPQAQRSDQVVLEALLLARARQLVEGALSPLTQAAQQVRDQLCVPRFAGDDVGAMLLSRALPCMRILLGDERAQALLEPAICCALRETCTRAFRLPLELHHTFLTSKFPLGALGAWCAG